VGVFAVTWILRIGSGPEVAWLMSNPQTCAPNPTDPELRTFMKSINPNYNPPAIFCYRTHSNVFEVLSGLIIPIGFMFDLFRAYWTAYGVAGFFTAVFSGIFLGWLWAYLKWKSQKV
jgi:hypothetical protein